MMSHLNADRFALEDKQEKASSAFKIDGGASAGLHFKERYHSKGALRWKIRGAGKGVQGGSGRKG